MFLRGDEQKVMFLLGFLGTLLFTYKCIRTFRGGAGRWAGLQVLGKKAGVRGTFSSFPGSGLLLPPFRAHQGPPASLSPWAWPGFSFQRVAQPQAQAHLFQTLPLVSPFSAGKS